MKLHQFSAGVVLAIGIVASAQASVSASLDRTQIGSGEGVQLILQRDGSSNGQPDLSPLSHDFKVLGTSSGSSVQFINGHVSSKVQLSVTLLPKHDGVLQIPSIQWDGEATPVLELTVGGSGTAEPASPAASGDSREVYFDLNLERKQAYVGGAVLLTMRLHTDQTLHQASLDFQGNSDLKVQQIGKDKQGTETHDGRDYQVIERQYALLPKRSGPLKLDGPSLDAQVEDARAADPFASDSIFGGAFAHTPLAGMLNARRPLHLQAKPILLDVQPPPPQVSSDAWLPAQSLVLQQDWRPENSTLHVGDPLARHLHLHADGVTAVQLPDLSTRMALPDGLKAYPDQAKLDTTAAGGKLLADRDQDIALIATRPGRFTIPELQLSWWDTNANAVRHAVLPGQTLDILPAIGAAMLSNTPSAGVPNTQPADAAASQQLSSPGVPNNQEATGANGWRWASVGLSLLWLGTLAVWWWTRKRRGPRLDTGSSKSPHADKTTGIGAALRTFQHSARGNDPLAARRHLLAWARAKWPHEPTAGLQALAQRLQEPALASLILALDRACYANLEWRGDPLADALKAQRLPAAKKSKHAAEIAALYD